MANEEGFMIRLFLTAALLGAALYSQDRKFSTDRDAIHADIFVLKGDAVRVPSLDNWFLGALRASNKWAALEREKQAPVLVAGEDAPAKFELAVDLKRFFDSWAEYKIRLTRLADGKVYAECTYYLSEDASRQSINKQCAQSIANKWLLSGPPVKTQGAFARGYNDMDHTRWHRQIAFEAEHFRNQIRIRRGR